LAGAISLAFGPELWWSFAASTETSRKLLLEQGDAGFEKLQSVFAAVRMWGGGISFAYMVQAAASAAAVCSVAWIWRLSGNPELKAALLMVATLLASPHVLDYDLMLVAPTIAFLVIASSANGFRNYEITLLAAVWIVPLLARGIADTTGIPLGLMAVLVLYALIMRRATIDRARLDLASARIAQA
jgi:alpha-1,2-mannosyltransferase